jgi:hypothetical protein
MQRPRADLRSTKDARGASARKIAQRTITVRTVKHSGQARNNPMSAARSLLEDGHLTLKQVAAFCGFADANTSGASCVPRLPSIGSGMSQWTAIGHPATLGLYRPQA